MLTTALAIGVLLLLYSVLYLYRQRGDASRDMITGLPNRDFFERYLQNCAARAVRRPGYGYGVLFLDIRGFTEMRRRFGRFAAEEILADFAERMFWCIRPTDVLSRFEGDDFAIILEDVRHITDVTRVALRVQSSMTQAMTLASREIRVRVCIGVTVSQPGVVQDARVLITQAETALARALESDRPYVVYDGDLDARSVVDLKLESELMAALAAGQLSLGFQPLIASDTGALAGFSAMLQWIHPQRGLLNAREFIHMAENAREIVRIGAWVVAETAASLRAFSAAAGRQLLVTCNVSATELEHGDVASQLEAAMPANPAHDSGLRLEVPAAALTSVGPKLEDTARRLHALGVGLHVDRAELDSIPLWRTSRIGVAGLRLNVSGPNAPDMPTLFRFLTTFRTLADEIVIEGIETREAYEAVAKLQPSVFAQGYYIGRPMPLKEALRVAAAPSPLWIAGDSTPAQQTLAESPRPI